MNNIKRPDEKSLAQVVKEWLETDEGKKAIKESIKRSDEMIARLNKLREIDPKRLQEPFTI